MNIPYGYCHCGCERRTRLASRNRASAGHVKGEPLPFLQGHNRLKPLSARWEEDPATGCWNWACYRDELGYGHTVVRGGGSRLAHRLVYEEHVGVIPDGLQLDHLCRNPSCVNPAHLEPVTSAENVRRGLVPRLTPEQVLAIRASRGSARTVAAEYGVSKSNVEAIRSGLTWRDLTNENETETACAS